nr:PREDICTED: CMRF35-like molecule 5 isoform X2 [Lepisosteus oculatus]
MKSSLYVLTLFIGLGCVTSAERRVNGSEGESVEIQCNYPDAYQYKKKYWCRHPCGNKDLLIKTGKTDTVVTVGRFSLYDNVSIRTFTVTMSRLTLQDTGVYYCGLEQRGTDRLSKIHLRVRKAPTVPTVTPSAPGSVTEEVTATALTASSSQDTASSTTGDGNESLSRSLPDQTATLMQDHKGTIFNWVFPFPISLVLEPHDTGRLISELKLCHTKLIQRVILS